MICTHRPPSITHYPPSAADNRRRMARSGWRVADGGWRKDEGGMSVKRISLSGLVVALWSLGVVHAQQPTPPAGTEVLPLYTPSGTDGPSPNAPAPAGSTAASGEGSAAPLPQQPVILGLPASPWLVYPRSPCCCGPVGGCGGPLGYEMFFRSGIAFTIGGGVFGDFLRNGWDVEGGGRLLFFNPPSTKAWTITLGVSNIFARTGTDNEPVTLLNFPVRTAIRIPGTAAPGAIATTTPVVLPVPSLQATVSSLNMTFVNAGFGREWYLLGTADPGQMHGCNWRVGIDGGGRWGSAMVQFNEINHHTDVVGGLYCAIHTDVEYPWRCGILQAGIRYEYNYIWNDILQSQNPSDYQSMNLLFQIGARF
jgi:hypothetical protein